VKDQKFRFPFFKKVIIFYHSIFFLSVNYQIWFASFWTF